MELDVHDRITADPKPGDVIAAIDQRGDDPDWFINLSDDDGYVEAFPEGDGLFRMAYWRGKEGFDSAEPVDAETLKAVLLAALRGEEGWRTERSWRRRPTRAQAAEAAGEPPVWAIAAVVASVAFVVLVANLPRDWLPFLDTTPGTVALFALPVVAMIGAMVANAAFKVRRAKNWLQAQGRITRSKIAVRRPPAGNEIGTVTNVPDIAYTFSVGGKNHQGTRVSLGDISGKYAEETVARYPVGSAVTVHYDPADPGSCVLERDAPKGAVKGCGIVLLVLAALGAGFYWAITSGSEALQAQMPRAEVPVMLFAALFGLAALVFFIAYRRYLARANAWPVVDGKVVSSVVEQRSSSDDGRSRRTYVAVVEYAYTVNGNRLHSRQIALGMQSSGSESAAQKVVARYPTGAKVEVHYNPENASEAALENPTGASWMIFGVALFCFAVAVYASHVFR